MPEGPSVVILKESVKQFKGKKILGVSGNSKIDQSRLLNKTVVDFKSWGKHFLICFKKFSLRIHFLLWGSYRINEDRDLKPRLSLKFSNGKLNFYSCSIRFIEENLDEVYDWSADVMNKNWDEQKALQKLKLFRHAPVCDVLLNQQVFAGVGNIIKNEVLFRIRVHPLSVVGKLPSRKKRQLVSEAVKYSFDFLKWKKDFVLRKNWKVHRKKICPRCNLPIALKYLGETNRRTFYCENCQRLYI